MVEEWFVRQLEELSTSVDYETKAVLHETKNFYWKFQNEKSNYKEKSMENPGIIKNGEFCL